MTKAEELARFIVKARFGDLSGEAVKQLKIRVLDSLGCAIGALNSGPVSMIRDQLEGARISQYGVGMHPCDISRNERYYRTE